MTDNCNIIRDLMPLVIDEAASNDSAQCVEAHLKSCTACQAYFEGMKSALDAQKAQAEEQLAFIQAARRLKKKRRLRIVRNVLIGMLIGCVLMWGGLYGWQYMTMRYTQLVYHGFYGVTLSRLQSGQVSVNIDYRGSSVLSGVTVNDAEEDGKHILYVYLEQSIIPQYAASPLKNYSCTRILPERMTELYEIRQGKPDEYVTVWQQGGEIPAASPEMEEWLALTEAYQSIWDGVRQSDDGKALITHQERDEMNALLNQRHSIIVPEWQ